MKKFIKKIFKAYVKSMSELYSDAWKAGIIPYNF